MTPVQTGARKENRTGLTAGDAMGAPGLQVDDHMTVDVALSVLVSARVEHLVVQDEDGRCSGLVTRAQLAAHRGGSWYSERTRLRDIPLDRGPFTFSATHLSDAEAAMRVRTLDVSPVVDENGYTLGVLALAPDRPQTVNSFRSLPFNPAEALCAASSHTPLST